MIDSENQFPTDSENQLTTDVEEPLSTDSEEHSPPSAKIDSSVVEELNRRFLQAISYFIEWAKHIITIGSALMLLSVALLRDIVRDAQIPIPYIIASLLVLSYLSMLGAIWLALRLVRFAAGCVLTTKTQIVTGDKLTSLKSRLDRVQMLFLVSLTFFSGLALCALLTWSFWLDGST